MTWTPLPLTKQRNAKRLNQLVAESKPLRKIDEVMWA